jgi:hypothetical protein
MQHKITLFILILVLSVLGENIKAADPVDRFITDRCGYECNGESDDCRVCYNEAVDLFEQKDQQSPETSWDIYNDHGKLKLVF